ncbi:nuclear autoantigenic sperm protein isoform X4 [Hypanus sabinus]|uniref:nuclear autoantigenic sperm protein isoform X4 n=1 Tax=Hypanus sabinus TaxID=79690 RepID=UPI0028C4311D|nr:nuclear autoantigenic sperm protein isoform X4 [Hypanus sabinus]
MADQEPSASTSSIAGSAEGTDGVEAMKLLGAGKRHMVMEDFAAAVNAFQDACRLLSTAHGEIADECGEAYFCYGKALLELARMERGVLGNALQGVPDDDDDDEEDEDDQETATAEGPKIENAANVDEKEREELREQVYAALAEEQINKPAETNVQVENISSDEDVDHEEKTDPPEKADKVNTLAKELHTTQSEIRMETGSLDDLDKDGKSEPMDEVGSHQESGDGVKEEDVEQCLEDKNISAKEIIAPEDGDEKAITDASVESGKIDLERKICLPLEKDTQKVQDKLNEKPSQENIKGADSEGNKVTEKSDSKQEDGTTGCEEPMDEGEGAHAADASEGDDENEDTTEKDGESEEVDNLQLAWEMLELAKIIFKRQETKEIQLCAAQAYLKLGEVGIESENYVQAIEDFNECLTIQEKHLDPHNRLLAETHYQLGLAYSFNNQHDFSLKHFKDSFSVIEKRLAMLTERIEKAEEKGKLPAKDNETVSEDKQEVEELKELLPEIKAKIEDAEESKDGKATKALQETLVSSRTPAFPVTETIANSAPTSAIQSGKMGEAPTSSSNSVSNISHLVRKKSSLQRKPEDSERDTKDPKKAKQEESSVNGGCGDAHDKNGVPAKMESEEIASKKSDPEAQSTS